MISINWWAVAAAGVSAFLAGGLWYSPLLFANTWMKMNGFSESDLKAGNSARIYGWSFVLSLIMAANLAMFLADRKGGCGPKTDIVWGTTAGFLAGIWIFCGIAIIALFELKPARYIFINGGYCLLALTLMGAIIGLWR